MKLAEEMKNKSIEKALENKSELYDIVINLVNQKASIGATSVNYSGELTQSDITVLKYIDGFKVEILHKESMNNGIGYIVTYYFISWE